MDVVEFKRLFLPCHKKMYWVAWRLLESKEEAEDLVQEAFLKLWTHRHELNQIQSAEAYAVTVVKRLFYNQYRLKRPQLTSDVPDLPTDDNQHDRLEKQEEHATLQTLIDRLPQQQRQLITLRDLAEYSYAEIAQTTGLTEGNIRVLISRGRKTLREMIAQKKITTQES